MESTHNAPVPPLCRKVLQSVLETRPGEKGSGSARQALSVISCGAACLRAALEWSMQTGQHLLEQRPVAETVKPFIPQP
jgi:hypothetical protein